MTASLNHTATTTTATISAAADPTHSTADLTADITADLTADITADITAGFIADADTSPNSHPNRADNSHPNAHPNPRENAHPKPRTGPTLDADTLCRAHLPLVHFEVRAISSRLPGHVYTDDLISAGMAALAMAAHSFDPTLGVPFGRYAVRRIRGALLDELRSADWATRSLRAKVRKRDAIHDSLAADLGRRPTDTETAAAMGITTTELERLDADLHTSVVLRLDVITDTTGADAILPATTQTPEATLIARERTAYLRDAINVLPERLQTVIRGCFFDDRPMRELADELGVTESRISQMRAEALKLLRDGINSQLDPDQLPTPTNATGAVARRKAAYYAHIATRTSYRDRLTLTTPTTEHATPTTTPTAHTA